MAILIYCSFADDTPNMIMVFKSLSKYKQLMGVSCSSLSLGTLLSQYSVYMKQYFYLLFSEALIE